MNKGRQLTIFYALVAFVSIFSFFALRWFSYRTPKVEITVRKYEVNKGDSLLMKSNISIVDDKYYYGLDSTFVTVSAGTFPFLEKKTVTKTSRWSRNVWNEYGN